MIELVVGASVAQAPSILSKGTDLSHRVTSLQLWHAMMYIPHAFYPNVVVCVFS